MHNEEYIYEPHSHRGRRKKAGTPVDLERIHEKNGHYDGKIFYSATKVTYTFVEGNEVVVLHFDLEKNALFLKGHKITALSDHPQLSVLLVRFKQCLTENPKTKIFVKPFETALISLGDEV